MSLINDALKRAKEAQKQNPQSVTPPEIPVLVTAPPSRSGAPAWLWLVIIVLLVGVGAFLIGQSMHKRGETILARSTAADSKSRTVSSTTTESKPTTVASSIFPAPAANISSQPITTEPKAMETVSQTNAVETAIAATPPIPPPLKLQSIIYDAQHPSVMINGKLLFVGDSLGELRVQEIRRNGVTLVGAGKTNVLNLPGY